MVEGIGRGQNGGEGKAVAARDDEAGGRLMGSAPDAAGGAGGRVG